MGAALLEPGRGNAASEVRGSGTWGHCSLHVRGGLTTMNRPSVSGSGLDWQRDFLDYGGRTRLTQSRELPSPVRVAFVERSAERDVLGLRLPVASLES